MTKKLNEYQAAQAHAENFLCVTFMGQNARRREADRSPLRDPDFRERFGKMPFTEIYEWAKWWYSAYDAESLRIAREHLKKS